MAIGLPKIEIVFKQLAVSAIERSGRGVVVLIVKDDTDKSFNMVEYKTSLEVDSAKFTAENVQYIKDCFLGTPAKVIVVRVNVEEVSALNKAIEVIGAKNYNWIGFAEGTTEEQTALATYIKQTETDGLTKKAVVFNCATADCMHVVNFKNAKVTFADERGEVTGDKYVARLLGLLAGMSMNQSATYKILSDLTSVSEVTNVEEAIDAGGFCLINDDEDVRVARAVNSLKTTSSTVTEDMKKIVVVESMDIIKDDITSTFRKEYIGKYKNRYDNQVLFISAVKSYFKQLESEEILDSSYDNTVEVDVEAQRLAWTSIGKTEAESWDETTVRNNTFRSNVYLAGSIKILDAMEDLKFVITML